jgi:Txe/YoeB family toxin of Txe-Axe toxin-antitoxin module
MIGKPVKIGFLEDANQEYNSLNLIVKKQIQEGKENTPEMQLLKSANQKIDFIRADPFYGDQVQKDLIPREYKLKYNVKNVWRVELTGYWRMLYTIRGDDVEIICFILDIIDHKEYDKLFGYEKM